MHGSDWVTRGFGMHSFDSLGVGGGRYSLCFRVGGCDGCFILRPEPPADDTTPTGRLARDKVDAIKDGLENSQHSYSIRHPIKRTDKSSSTSTSLPLAHAPSYSHRSPTHVATTFQELEVAQRQVYNLATNMPECQLQR